MFFSSSRSTCIACGSQLISCPVWKPMANLFLAGCARPACRFDRGIDLHQRQAGVVEKGLARSGQLDAMNAARQQLGPDLVLQIANLPAQRGLGSVELALGGGREAAFLDHGHEITQVPQLHSHSMPERYAPQLTKSFSKPQYEPRVAAMELGLSIDKPLLSNVLSASAGYKEERNE